MNARLKLNLDRLTGTFDIDPSSSRIYSRDAAIDLIVHGFDEGEVTPVDEGGATPPGKPVVQFVNSAGRVVAQAMLAQPTGEGAGGAGADGKYDLVATLSTNTVEMRREFFWAGPQAVREFTVRILDTETANPIACGPFPVFNFPGVCGDAPTELPSASEVLAELRQMIEEHAGRTDNPHAVTAALLSALTQADGDARYALKASVTTLSGQATQAVQQSAAAVAAMRQHADRSDNPHGVTAAQVGLGNVDNTADVDKPVSTRQQAAIAAAKEQVANLVQAEARRATDAEAALSSTKQDKLTGQQLAAVNSGIDAGKVAKIAQNESAISAEVSRAKTEEARLQTFINAIKTFEVVVADSLPSPSEQYSEKLYLIPSTNPETRNVKDEFICVKVDNVWGWEQVGSTAITIEFDAEPTEGSQKAVRSGGIWSWVKSLLPHWLTASYAEPATVESVNGKQSKITVSGILKGDGQGGVTTAEKSSTSADPANADYRDPQDNTCHKTEFGEWVASVDVPDTVNAQPEYSEADRVWFWYRKSGRNPEDLFAVSERATDDKDVELTFYKTEGGTPIVGGAFTATRSSVCTDGKKFVTSDAVDGKVSAAVSTNNPAFVSAVQNTPAPEPGQGEDPPWGTWGTVGAAIAGLVAGLKWLKDKVFDSAGNIQDQFATDLLGKQVAIQKIDERLPISISTKSSDFTTESYKRFVVTVGGNMNVTLHTPTAKQGGGYDAEVFECRFDGASLAADASVTFSGATATTMDTDCGTVKAGKIALMSAFWNGATWDVNWKVEG